MVKRYESGAMAAVRMYYLMHISDHRHLCHHISPLNGDDFEVIGISIEKNGRRVKVHNVAESTNLLRDIIQSQYNDGGYLPSKFAALPLHRRRCARSPFALPLYRRKDCLHRTDDACVKNILAATCCGAMFCHECVYGNEKFINQTGNVRCPVCCGTFSKRDSRAVSLHIHVDQDENRDWNDFLRYKQNIKGLPRCPIENCTDEDWKQVFTNSHPVIRIPDNLKYDLYFRKYHTDC